MAIGRSRCSTPVRTPRKAALKNGHPPMATTAVDKASDSQVNSSKISGSSGDSPK